jgi:hypothetical protein
MVHSKFQRLNHKTEVGALALRYQRSLTGEACEASPVTKPAALHKTTSGLKMKTQLKEDDVRSSSLPQGAPEPSQSPNLKACFLMLLLPNIFGPDVNCLR